MEINEEVRKELVSLLRAMIGAGMYPEQEIVDRAIDRMIEDVTKGG